MTIIVPDAQVAPATADLVVDLARRGARYLRVVRPATCDNCVPTIVWPVGFTPFVRLAFGQLAPDEPGGVKWLMAQDEWR